MTHPQVMNSISNKYTLYLVFNKFIKWDEKGDDLTDWPDDSNKLCIWCFCFVIVLPESDANFAKNEGKVKSYSFFVPVFVIIRKYLWFKKFF